MILWRSRVDSETAISPGLEHLGLRAWRWVLEIGWIYVDLRHEVRFSTGDWRPAVRYYRADLTPRFAWGRDHAYYDGPHCSLSVGWLHFSWSPQARCWQCEPEEL